MVDPKNSIEGYDLPEEESVVLDLSTEKVVDKENLTPWQMLELTAKQNKIEIKPPKEDCRKRGCYGRGYTGFEGGYPVPCSCIFPKGHTSNQFIPNRAIVRNYQKMARRELQNLKNSKMKELNLVCVDKNIYRNKKGKLFSWDTGKGIFSPIKSRNETNGHKA